MNLYQMGRGGHGAPGELLDDQEYSERIPGMDEQEFVITGYKIIRSFVDSDELPFLREKVEQGLTVPPQPGCSRPGNDLHPLRWNDEIVAYLLQSARRLQRLREILNPGDLKWISAYLSTKPPHSPALWWHQDWWCWDHPISFSWAAPQVALLCYLTDTNKQNGALRILPGSHHSSTSMHRVLPEPHGEIANASPADHIALADLAEQITIELQAGDAIVLDYRLLHGTHANDTPKRRDCILLSFTPTWNTLPRELRAHLIAHPALPVETEDKDRSASRYDDILPRFEGSSADLSINRVPPANFTIRDSLSIDC